MSGSAYDIRFPMGALVLLPWLLWATAPIPWIVNVPRGYGLTIGVALLVLGGWVVRKSTDWIYVLARGYLPKGHTARPGEEFLFFELEDLATADKLKLFGDELGCIFPEADHLRIRTSKRDVCIPPNHLEMATYRPKGKAQGVLLRWTDPNGGEAYEGVASFKYAGKDLKVAADTGQKAQWAQAIIQRWAATDGVAPDNLETSGSQPTPAGQA